ncbi:small membrane protein [Clavibacter michiganensis subsp. insidiosus]|uniref:Small membrane protein n=1 Tax=Clavibacter michiganensis subsp. insidiosus TaxID=33014 RepID=A0A0D5CKV8_9MICO|nr:small membrane protein [Clavibacter michiganensis subsp. insidiosus]AWF99784.1 hypothetical protein BEH61_14855 [Clavibacter michiganensis subsp. insidiosus]AWG02887.1 hypothetical protein BEH62_14935 [Clavibacter michiganensis subsp. insidiosus]
MTSPLPRLAAAAAGAVVGLAVVCAVGVARGIVYANRAF